MLDLAGIVARVFGRHVEIAPRPVVLLGQYDSGSGDPSPLPVALSSAGKMILDPSSAVPMIGYSDAVSGTVIRPADTTTYASGDLVANSTAAGSVIPITLAVARVNDGGGTIRRARLKKTGISITNASFRVHFYKASPTASNGDNGAWLTTESIYLGSADVTMDKVFSDGAKGIGAVAVGTEINFTAASGTKNIFALIEARAAYTPSSAETFTLTVEVTQN